MHATNAKWDVYFLLNRLTGVMHAEDVDCAFSVWFD